MTQTFDLRQGLQHARENRGAAWEFISDFAREWAQPLADGDGCTEAELAEAEARLGLALPAALREAYLLLGRREDLTSNHDVLLDPGRLCVDDRKQALVFRHENQMCAAWGVLLSDLTQADPPVYELLDLADKHGEQWAPWMERVSWMFVEIVMAESLHTPPELSDFISDFDPESQGILQANCTELPFSAYPADGFEATRWYLGDDVIVRDEGGFLPVRARTAGALDAVRALLPGPWLSQSRFRAAD
jgi:hypothetical protein